MQLSPPGYIAELEPYVPGAPIEWVARQYGITHSVKLASNENPLGPSPMAVAAMAQALETINRYPDGGGYRLTRAISDKYGIPADNIVLGNGSDEIIELLSRLLLTPGDEVVIAHPSFSMYTLTARGLGATPVLAPLKDYVIDLAAIQARISRKTRLVFLCNPNNPTGTALPMDQLRAFLAQAPSNVLVVIDEAYIEYVRDSRLGSLIADAAQDRPIAVLRTFSKLYGLAGLRIGFGVMPKNMVDWINRIRSPFNTNSLAQTAAVAALADDDFIARSLNLAHAGIDHMHHQLTRMGLTVIDSQTNFLLIDLHVDADRICQSLLGQGIIVRSMRSTGYPQCIRVNAGLPAENQAFLDALKSLVSTGGQLP